MNKLLESKINKFGVVCPICKNSLTLSENSATCDHCNRRYPIINGILDLRVPPCEIDQTVKSMIQSYKSSTFSELISIALDAYILTNRMLEDTLAYYEQQIERNRRMTNMFIESFENTYHLLKRKKALDLGCGSGAGVHTLSKYFNKVIGIDSSIKQLILARKTLEENTNENFILVCASADNLPLKDETIDYIQAINVIEHLLNIDPAIKDLSRVLSFGSGFVADSRNRFDIFFPEPHTGYRFLGFLPRNWIPKYVKWRSGSEYEHTRLQSYNDLNKAMKKNFHGQYKISYSKAKAYSKPDWIDKSMEYLLIIPLIRRIALQVYPSHLVLGRKIN
jgi:ubiquinone/menaquinone biosynthesis C-methylase UbiE